MLASWKFKSSRPHHRKFYMRAMPAWDRIFRTLSQWLTVLQFLATRVPGVHCSLCEAAVTHPTDLLYPGSAEMLLALCSLACLSVPLKKKWFPLIVRSWYL